MESKETTSEYVSRAANSSLRWLLDRSGTLHPIIYGELDAVREMLSDYLKPRTSEFYKIELRPLNKTELVAVQTLLEDFIWAKRIK